MTNLGVAYGVPYLFFGISMGIESRVGIGFDRHRKTSAFQNKIVYVNEGVKKSLFHKKISIPHLVDRMLTFDEGGK